MEKYLIVIAGPTAVGKTELSIQLAKQLKTEIISADSRQFFRELSIGTAKPSAQELETVPHHLINSHSIAESYSAGDFERDVLQLLDGLFENNDCVVMTGGSGLYIKAVLEGLDELPSPSAGLRASLMSRLAEEGLTALQADVKKLDPEFAATPELLNPQRVLRALEVFYTSGVPISGFKQNNKQERRFKPVLIALDRERAELYHRIDSRMDIMLKSGLVAEAEGMISFRRHHALQTVGYKEVFGYLDGVYSYAEMERLLKQNSRRYAKRQLTWFRHQGEFHWFHPDDLNAMTQYVSRETGTV